MFTISSKTKHFFASAAMAGALAFSGSAVAGPFILAGTDADDHGFASGGVNQDGWFFMQRSLENLAAAGSLTNTNMHVVNLGSSGSTAQAAATSAFNLSSLSGSGWSFSNVDGDTDVTNFFNGTGTVNINNTSLIMMDSGNHVGGGSSSSERGIFTTNASVIDTFLGNGGGLFSQANGYGWVSALLPSLTVIGSSGSGISLTPGGNSAFPGLTNPDLSSGPFHNRFDNVGALTVLGTANDNGEAVIIGSSGGSVSAPTPVAEPGMIAIFAISLAGLGYVRRKRTA
ncbi:MAG: hypothetical protein ACI9JL_004135 [Paracoccaceae bacterium]|jgi:hypothetical protein